MKYLRNKFFSCGFVQIHPFVSFGVTLFKVLDKNKELSSTTLFKQPHQWGFKCFNITCRNLVDLQLKFCKYENYTNVFQAYPKDRQMLKLFQEVYLPFIVYETTIYSLEVQILGNISMDKYTYQSSICHHELTKCIEKCYTTYRK